MRCFSGLLIFLVSLFELIIFFLWRLRRSRVGSLCKIFTAERDKIKGIWEKLQG